METTTALTEAERKGQYDAEKRRFGLATTQTNPSTGAAGDMATYARHLVEVTNLYRGHKNGFARCMAEVERRCAKTHGFPEYEQWAEKNH